MNAYSGRVPLRTGYGPAQAHTQIDVSIQADLVGYESEDERMGRRGKSKRGTPYSKIDIREQYCINNKEVQVLESQSSALFGCLSKHHGGSCKSRHSFLSVCMGRAPSDENLHDIKLQPLPRRPIDDLERAYLRQRPKSVCGTDAARYKFIPEEEELSPTERGRATHPDAEYAGMKRGYTISFSSEHLASSCPAHYLPPPPPPPAGAARTKHVSFARSHTLTSFDDAIIELRKIPHIYKSQERLILSTQPPKKAIHAVCDQRAAKKVPMKTQATQTGCLGREPPNYLSLSPRTVHRVKMVSQGAQTNGQLWNGRRLMKSYSEAGCYFGDGRSMERNKDHEVLTRTQSEEPRSPYMKGAPVLQWPGIEQASINGVSKSEERKSARSSRAYKEIFIDFEPVENEKAFGKNFSEGDFESEQGLEMDVDDQIVDRVDGIKVSLASFSDDEMPNSQTNGAHQCLRAQDSVDEEFHENLIYGGIFSKYTSADLPVLRNETDGEKTMKRSGASTPDVREMLPTATLNVSRRASPFASSDSLANDQKDHSEGIWNESQSTVLQAELENGEISMNTPSKKQLLLLQHQQRSSVDTEILENDILHSQSPVYSPLSKESAVPFVTVAAVHKSPTAAQVPRMFQIDRTPHNLSAAPTLMYGLRDARRKSNKSPEKQEPRLDPGKANDVSENSTTDDYATAYDNSGTDTSSRKSMSHQQRVSGSKPGSKEGSSFESASSAHSFPKDDTIHVVPSSPPTIAEEQAEDNERLVEEYATLGNLAAEGKESADMQDQADEKEEMSADLDSSSSGSYSLDSGQHDQKSGWSEQDKEHSKNGFSLDILTSNANDSESRRKEKGTADVILQSPQQLQQTKPKFTPSSSRRTQQVEAEMSSDESSCEYKTTGADDIINGHSPRRQRRRGGGGGGTGRGRRDHMLAADHSAKRKPLIQVPSNTQPQLNPSSSMLGRSSALSPKGSPRKTVKLVRAQEHKRANADTQESGTHLKTLSAESLRSVSPGSDSVFYTEAETHMLCHQCGREFEGEASRAEAEQNVEEIVQPPEGFADSPENTKNKSLRLYKKQEKRFRSEDRGGERRRHSRYRPENMRAKSEERGKEKTSKSKLRPRTARSTDASMERLRGAESSPSISEPLTGEEPKVYSDSFKNGSWICIKEGEPGWSRSLDADENKLSDDATREMTDSTSSEKEFRRKYQAATHRMVHRKSSIGMYKRLQAKSFGTDCNFEDDRSLKQRLEDLMQMMLVVWSTQEKALRVTNGECDKKVIVRRKSGEFGFRIHGSRPVVVSAIEPDTPAESSGLEVGDIVLSVNGVSVLEASHSDVVKLAHAGSDTLELEVARTSTALTPLTNDEDIVTFSGFLNKRGTDGRWHQRWFALKNDNCLYYFKSQLETQPIGALMLFNYSFKFTPNSGKANSFVLQKEGAKSLELYADAKDTTYKWKAYLEKAMDANPNSEGRWFERSCQLLLQSASSVAEPDCCGHLTQLEDRWRRRYCVLKDAALFIYSDSTAPRALAVVCLQGYRVQSSGVSGKRFSFEVVPPEAKQKHFYFYADTEMDKKRWIAAIEYSVDRWMRVK